MAGIRYFIPKLFTEKPYDKDQWRLLALFIAQLKMVFSKATLYLKVSSIRFGKSIYWLELSGSLVNPKIW